MTDEIIYTIFNQYFFQIFLPAVALLVIVVFAIHIFKDSN